MQERLELLDRDTETLRFGSPTRLWVHCEFRISKIHCHKHIQLEDRVQKRNGLIYNEKDEAPRLCSK